MLTTTITITAAWPEPIYLYACWLSFLFAFFRIKDSTDFKGFENVV